MSVLEIVFLLCARFSALHEKRTYTPCWNIKVHFSNGASPVVFYEEQIWADDGSCYEIHWKASRKLTKKETQIAERVLRCRIKRIRRKFPRGYNNTKLYNDTIDALRSLHQAHPMEYIALDGKKIAYRTNSYKDDVYDDADDFSWQVGTLMLYRSVVLTEKLLVDLLELPHYITGSMIAGCFRTPLAIADFKAAFSTPFTWVEHCPWAKPLKKSYLWEDDDSDYEW